MKNFPFLIALFLVVSACDPAEKNATTTENASSGSGAAVVRPAGTGTETTTDTLAGQDTPVASNKLIVPGKSIGLIKINEQAEVVNKLFGKPDQANAGMGKSLQTWNYQPDFAAGDTTSYKTSIFFSRNMGGADEASRVKQIRITSPFFITENGISTSSGLETIRRHFPNLKKSATYTLKNAAKPVTVYTAVKEGITFEADEAGTCRGITIFEPGKPPFEVYSEVSANFERL